MNDGILPSNNLPPFPWSSLSFPGGVLSFAWLQHSLEDLWSHLYLVWQLLLGLYEAPKGAQIVCPRLCGGPFRTLMSLRWADPSVHWLDRLLTSPRSEQDTPKKTHRTCFTGTPFSLSLADFHWLGTGGINVHWSYPKWVKDVCSAVVSRSRNTKLLSQRLGLGWMQDSHFKVFLFHCADLYETLI